MKKILQTGIFKGTSGYSPVVELPDGTCLFAGEYFDCEEDAQVALSFATRLVEVIFQDLPKKGKATCRTLKV